VRLWDEEIEAMRDEARTMVEQGIGALAGQVVGDVVDADPHARIVAQREQRRAAYVTVDDAVDRELNGVRCRTFATEGPAPAVYLHFHGGGMVMGDPEMMDVSNRALARRHGVAIVSVDYRKAPEHPYPAGPDDGVAVAAWLLEHAADEYGTDRLILGGESAGGYMTAAVLLRIRDELGAIDRVDGANVVFGVLDWGRSPSQRGTRPTSVPDILDPDGILSFCDAYLPGRTDEERRDPAVSPAFADLGGLPPALFSVGTADHLLDDTLLMAARYAAAGNETELFVAPDLPHGFMAFPCGITKRWADTTDAWFTARLTR
jgi:acetyl esterase/lipase